MTESATQRMILRKTGSDGLSLGETVERVGSAGATVLEQNPGSLLLEGDAAAIGRAIEDVPGWKAMPVRSYPRPDTKARISR